jgi:hypothetical protein
MFDSQNGVLPPNFDSPILRWFGLCGVGTRTVDVQYVRTPVGGARVSTETLSKTAHLLIAVGVRFSLVVIFPKQNCHRELFTTKANPAPTATLDQKVR